METTNFEKLDRLSSIFCDLTACLENEDWTKLMELAGDLEELISESTRNRGIFADLKTAASIADKPVLYLLLQNIDREISDLYSRQALQTGQVVLTDWRNVSMFESVARTLMYVVKHDQNRNVYLARCVDFPVIKSCADTHHEALELCIAMAADQIEVMDAIGDLDVGVEHSGAN